MIPAAWLVSLMSFAVVAGLVYIKWRMCKDINIERRAQHGWMREHLPFLTIPFFYLGIIYGWIALCNPSSDDRAPFVRWGYLVLLLVIGWYIIEYISSQIKGKHGI